MNNIKPICVTMGEPSGVSGEVILKIWSKKKNNLIPFFVYDDPERLKKISNFLGLDVPVKKIKSENESLEVFNEFLPVIPLDQKVEFKLGNPDFTNSKYVLDSIKKSVYSALNKKVCAIVTSPVCKQMLIKYGFKFSGQTEFISDLVSKFTKKKYEEVMILSTTKPVDLSNNLRVGLITTHLPMKNITDLLTKKKIINKTKSFADSLKKIWGIKEPKIGICSYNPHSGEFGLVGREEIEIILPAVKEISKNIQVFGPLSPDSCFSKYTRKDYDGFMCMYHDQALIPIKTLDFLNSVNITGGLPILRVSPDHGPAFDIARLNKVNINSTLASLNLVSNIVWNKKDSGSKKN